MIEWKKRDGYFVGHAEGERDVAVLKVGRRWHLYTDVVIKPSGHAAGKYLTWRPTLREAKERAGWAYLADLGGDDGDYARPEAA